MRDDFNNNELFTYRCSACGKIFKDETKPHFCPRCGGSGVLLRYGSKSRETALRYIDEIREQHDEAMYFWRAFAKRYAVVEDKMQTLRVYEKRGIISGDDIPKLKRPSLSNALKEYRAKKNSEGER